MPEDIAITELLEIDPDRVDAVTSPANGTEWLILKSTDGSETVGTTEDVLAEIAKADDASEDRPDCPTCHGDGKIMGNNRKCPDCKGSGVKPKPGDTEKSLAELAARKEAGVSDSGSGETPAKNCGTCGGLGKVGSKQNANQQNECPDCGGTGQDQATTNPDELNRVDAPGGDITEGAGGRETVDKSLCDDDECEVCKEIDDVEKAELKTKARNALDDSDFALPGRRYPIQDAAHARNALARVAQNGTPAEQAAVKAAVRKKYPDINVDGDDAEKNVMDGSMFTAANPALSSPVAQGSDPGSSGTDDGTPGSPAWEAVDAQTATDAAMALMAAAELIRTFAQRESTEVAVGEGNDIFDTSAAYAALCSVSDALGIMAQMAFHEGVEAAKSLPDEECAEKAGRRLAGKTIAALAAARDKAKDLASHIGGVLGDDDPTKKSKDNTDGGKSAADKFISSANKELLTKEIEDMTADELLRLLDERDAQKAANETAEKAETTEVAETTDDVVDDDAVKAEDEVATEDAAKAEEPVELTPEQIEARDAAKAAKKMAKAAKREQEALDQKIALTKSIEESLAKVVEQNEVLKSTVETLTNELEGVKKMAAPNDIVRTAPAEAQNVAKARDEIEIRIATLESEARTTPDPSVRAGNREIVKELRAQLADTKN